jgi:putative FmdB family regulatory protein
MPTYLYECPVHKEFEEFHSMSKTLENCPHCEEEGLPNQPVKKLINCSTKGKVELTGQDLVDKTKADTQKLNQEIHSSAKTYANFLGEEKYHQMQTQMDRAKRERR